MNLKEITVFTDGDSSKVKTWSNVPYFFTSELIARGIKVNRVDTSQNRTFATFFNKRIHKIWLLFSKKSIFYFDRTGLHYWLTERKIKRATQQFPLSDAWLFMDFSFHNKYSAKPSILFCDWTLEYLIKERFGREPDYLEQTYIKKQNNVIGKANLVVSLFPKIARLMQAVHPHANISHLETNVVNSFYKGELNAHEILSFKASSNILLFIGDTKYIAGARLLLKAFNSLKIEEPSLTLHIIGLEEPHFDKIPDGVTCYGYLDKENESDCQTYYDLMMKAKVFINPTPLWGGYSSTIEAMYFYNPIVIAPYEDFTYTFGDSPSFAAYNKKFEADDLALQIKKIIQSPDYRQLCTDAHLAVQDYTWKIYVDKFLIKLSGKTVTG